MALTPKRDRAPRELDQQTTAAKDSPWGGLRSRFLASLDPAEQVRIFDLSARTSQTLHRWAARYPLIRRVRVWPLSLSVAAGALFSSADGKLLDAVGTLAANAIRKHQLLQELRSNEAHLRAVLDNVAEGILTVDEEHRIA